MTVGEVVVLGAVGVLTGGAVEPVRSEKQRLLLAHLAASPDRPVSEHVLIDELWDAAPADPLHALQAHASRLRQATGLAVEYTAGGYQLGPVTTDAGRFEQLLSEAEQEFEPATRIELLRTALDLWRGQAFENVPDTSGLQVHRARLELLHEQAISMLVEAQLEAGLPEATLPMLERAVDLNPVDERRWVQLMTALHRSGRRAEALAAFARARDQLVEHLGLEPNAQLQELQREILQHDQPEPVRRPAAPQPPGDVVGRQDEWSALSRLWQEAQREQRVAILVGEPGIGKSHLATRFAAALAPTPVHAGRCHAGRAVPYEPLAQLIRSDCFGLSPADLAGRFGTSAAVLGRLVPDVLAGAGDPEAAGTLLEPQVEQHRIQLALLEWLRQATAAGPLCLLVDDLQWADSDSLRLLAWLWSEPVALPVLWLITQRDQEHPTGSPEARSVEAGLLAAATQASAATLSLHLEGLSRPAVSELMRSAMHAEHAEAEGDPTSAALDEMVTATAGNPLLVLETTRHLLERDESGAAVGVQRARPVPPSLTSIVEGHVSRLGASARELLDVAAIVGEDFDPLLVALATDRGPRELDEFLALGQHLRLLAPLEADPSRLRFRHALVHMVVLQQISPMRRAELHRRVAGAVQAHPHLSDRLHLLAHHHARAVSLVGADEAIRHLLAAGDAALTRRAADNALDLYRQAEALLTTDSPVTTRCDVHLGLGQAGFAAGIDYREDLLTAARLADEAGDVDRLVQSAVANTRGWYSSIAEVDRTLISVIERALALLPERGDMRQQAARSRLLSLWAMENVRDPARRKEVLSCSEESMQIADTLDDPDLLGEIMCHRFSVLYATLSDPIGSFEFAKRLDALAHSRIDPQLQLNSAIAVAQSAMTVGDFAEADRALERSLQLAEELCHSPRLWLVSTWVATRTAMRGDLAQAEAQAAAALDLGIACDQPDAFTWFAGQTFAFHHLAGRLPELVEVVEEQVAELNDQIPAWRAAHALTLISVGRHEEATAIVDDFHRRRFEDLPLDVLYLPALNHLAECVSALRHVPVAQDLYDALLPYRGMVATNATIDTGPIDLNLGRLAALTGAEALAAHHLREAEAWCRRSDAPVWLERVVAAQTELSAG